MFSDCVSVYVVRVCVHPGRGFLGPACRRLLVFIIFILLFTCFQISDDDITICEGRKSLFDRLIAECQKAHQLVSLSILLSAWPPITIDSDG